jgi:hypothetical protein
MKREKINICLFQCSLACFLSALSELKAFYFEFLIIILIAFLITDFSTRKLFAIVGALSALILGVILLGKLFPMFADFFSYSAARRIVLYGGYSTADSVNRLTFVPFFNKWVLNDTAKQLFGLGIGNCEVSSMSIFNTPFYNQYGWMRYDWLSAPNIYLEQGFVGLIMYFMFFIVGMVHTLRISKMNLIDKENGWTVIIVFILCMVISVYNSSLKTEAGYLMYFVLSIPFILKGKTSDNKELESKGVGAKLELKSK